MVAEEGTDVITLDKLKRISGDFLKVIDRESITIESLLDQKHRLPLHFSTGIPRELVEAVYSADPGNEGLWIRYDLLIGDHQRPYYPVSFNVNPGFKMGEIVIKAKRLIPGYEESVSQGRINIVQSKIINDPTIENLKQELGWIIDTRLKD